MNAEVHFWHAFKHQGLLQADAFILGVSPSSHVQTTQSKFAYLRNIATKACWMNIVFCLQMNTKVDSFIFGVQIQTCPKYTFTTFSQYLKKNVNKEILFFLLINVNGFFKVILSFSMCVSKHAQITPKTSLLFLRKILGKK